MPKPDTDTDQQDSSSAEPEEEIPLINCPDQTRFVKAILHRCVELDWRDSRLANEAGVSKGLWSQVRSVKKRITIRTMAKLASAVGLQIVYQEIKENISC